LRLKNNSNKPVFFFDSIQFIIQKPGFPRKFEIEKTIVINRVYYLIFCRLRLRKKPGFPRKFEIEKIIAINPTSSLIVYNR